MCTSQKLEAARVAAYMSIADLAREAGVAESNIRRWEKTKKVNGRLVSMYSPRVNDLKRIADALGVDINTLL